MNALLQVDTDTVELLTKQFLALDADGSGERRRRCHPFRPRHHALALAATTFRPCLLRARATPRRSYHVPGELDADDIKMLTEAVDALEGRSDPYEA